MCYRVILFIVCHLLLMNIASALSSPVHNMIFFGDSLSDVGNNSWVLMDKRDVGTPITNANNQNHKFLWVNYLAEAKLGKPVYSSSTTGTDPLNDNISYAYASAETGSDYLNIDWPQNDSAVTYVNTANCEAVGPGTIKNSAGEITSTCVPGLLRQVDIYLASVKYQPNPGTVFFIWTGSNDLTNYLKDYIVTNNAPLNEDNLLIEEKHIVANINLAKKRLIDAGVQPDRIYILNIPDLLKTPAMLTSDKSWKWFYIKLRYNLSRTMTALSANFNHELITQVVEEPYKIPASNYLNVAEVFDYVIANPAQYQLTNINESCVMHMADPLCAGYLFYDDKHPTTSAHKIVSDLALPLL